MGIQFDDEPIRLETLADGYAVVGFDEQLREVLKNIADPNTHRPKPEQPKRVITLEIEVKPTINEWGVVLDISARYKPPKLVVRRAALTHAQMVEKSGRQVAYEATAPARQTTINNVLRIKEKEND